MRTVIYSRVSTDMQDTQNQVQTLLLRYPGAEVVEEYMSGAKHRPKLEALLETLERDDKFVVMALDRIGRSTTDVMAKLDDLNKRGIKVISIREGIDFTTPSGEFMATIFAAFAQMERKIISERIKTALEAKKGQGIRLGRPDLYTQQDWDKARLLRDGGNTLREIEKLVGISRTSLSEYFKEVK